MKITTTAFNLDYAAEPVLTSKNGSMGSQVYHSCQVSNTMIIDDVEHIAVYQTGYNDYNYPSNDFELTFNCGTSETLELIYKLTTKDILEENEDTMETLEELKELSPAIDTVDKLLEVYSALCANHPGSVFDYLGEGHSDDLSDYEEDIIDEESGETSGILTLK